MGEIMELIDGVVIKQLKHIVDERGFLMEMLRNDDPFFQQFGQVYLTSCNPGYVKGWHFHKKQVDHFVVAHGTARIVLYDQRKDSKTHGKLNEFIMGNDNKILIRIPAGVMHGFECVGSEPCSIINIPNLPYNYKEPDEIKIPFDSPDIPYTWKAKKGG